MKNILNKEKIWSQYLDYLREWAYNHSEIKYFGETPKTFCQWWDEKSYEVFEV